MLLALCHRCWTWIEPKHERCVECGYTLDLHQPDPDPVTLQSLFGHPLGTLGEVSLRRSRLPAFGVLSAWDHGLLFLPDLRQLPSGGYAAIEGGNSQTSGSSRPGFWNLFARRTQIVPIAEACSVVRPELTIEQAVERFFDSPGALFVSRASLVRIIQRGTMLRVERQPGKTAVWQIESPFHVFQDNLARLS